MSLHGDRQHTLSLVLVAFAGGTTIILLKSRIGSDPHALELHVVSMSVLPQRTPAGEAWLAFAALLMN